jgi:uncharacterized repeat protein (TIGR01451 family)
MGTTTGGDTDIAPSTGSPSAEEILGTTGSSSSRKKGTTGTFGTMGTTTSEPSLFDAFTTFISSFFGWGEPSTTETTTIPSNEAGDGGFTNDAGSALFAAPAAPEAHCTSQALCEAPEVGGIWGAGDPACPCQSATLSLGISASDVVPAQGTIVHTVTIYNAGPSVAVGVVITDTDPLMLGLTFVPESSTPSCASGVCSVGDIPPGDIRVVNLAFALNPGQCDPITAAAAAKAADSPFAESPTITTTVDCGTKLGGG